LRKSFGQKERREIFFFQADQTRIRKISAVLPIGNFIFPQTGGEYFQTFQHFQKFFRLPQKKFLIPFFKEDFFSF